MSGSFTLRWLTGVSPREEPTRCFINRCIKIKMLATLLAPGFYIDVPVSRYAFCYEPPFPLLICSLEAVVFRPLRFSLVAKHEFLLNCRTSRLLQEKVMKEMNCDVLGSTSCRYFNPSSCWQHINIWKQGGLSRLTATSSWKKQRLFSKRSWSSLYHPSETSGDSRTLVTIPYVIICSIFSNYYVSALTSLQRELALLCQPPRLLLPKGWAAG